jgi:hypothetical protein
MMGKQSLGSGGWTIERHQDGSVTISNEHDFYKTWLRVDEVERLKALLK